MGAYKHNVVAVIRMGVYIHGVLIFLGTYYPDFTVFQVGVTMHTCAVEHYESAFQSSPYCMVARKTYQGFVLCIPVIL